VHVICHPSQEICSRPAADQVDARRHSSPLPIRTVYSSSGVDLVRKVGGRGMVGAGASWRSVTKFIYRRYHNFENGVENNAASGASRNFFLVSTPDCDIFEVH